MNIVEMELVIVFFLSVCRVCKEGLSFFTGLGREAWAVAFVVGFALYASESMTHCHMRSICRWIDSARVSRCLCVSCTVRSTGCWLVPAGPPFGCLSNRWWRYPVSALAAQRVHVLWPNAPKRCALSVPASKSIGARAVLATPDPV